MNTNGAPETPAIQAAPGDPPIVHLWRYPGIPMLAAVCGIDSKDRQVRVTTMLTGVTCPDCRRTAMEANR